MRAPSCRGWPTAANTAGTRVNASGASRWRHRPIAPPNACGWGRAWARGGGGSPGLRAREPIDAAVLDVNIAGEVVLPVADALSRRGIPFVFATAYGRAGVEARHLDRAVLQKPYDVRSLQRALEASLQGRS